MTYLIIAVLVVACIIMYNDKEQWREGHREKQDLINKGKDCYYQAVMDARKYLNIQCIVQPLEKYPMIKCNINLSTNEKIYHLPFDQQYDKCVTNKKLGECYVMTVQEAEDKGFRRAKRWYGYN